MRYSHQKYRDVAQARFWAKVDKVGSEDGLPLGACWLWTGARNGKGYGMFGNARRFMPGARVVLAHRASFFFSRGSLPPAGLQVRHLCHNPACVRPDHLDYGDAKQNARDSLDAGRYEHGEGHHSARLTDAKVAEIRRRRINGETGKALAREFGVSEGLIGHIRTGRIWKHVQPEQVGGTVDGGAP